MVSVGSLEAMVSRWPSPSREPAGIAARLWPEVLGYLVAVVSVAVALAASKLAVLYLYSGPYESLFFCAIMFAGWFGGYGPGFLSAALAVLAFDYFLLPPIYQFTVEITGLPRLCLFFVAALFVGLATAAQRSAARSLRCSRDELLTALQEQKQTEARLRDSEAYLAEAQRLSQTGSFGWNIATGELIWSEETFRIFERDQQETPTFESLIQRVHPDDRADVQQTIDRASADGNDFDHEYRLLMPNGTVKNVRAVAHAPKDASGRAVEFIGAITDITAAKYAKEELQRNELRFRDFAETASDWFWETGPDHRFISVSRESAAAGCVGLAVWEFATDVEEEPEKWRRQIATLEAHAPFRGFRFRARRADGSPIYYAASGKAIFDPSGRFVGYRGVASDLTAIVRAEQAEVALQEAQANLAHATRVTTLGELTASIAHEVSQPLSAVTANAAACQRWLDLGPPDVPAARQSVKWIVSDANRAAEVITRVRALASKTDTERGLVDLNEVVNEVRALVRRELFSNHVSLRLDLEVGALMVCADRIQLQQVIINLVMNGIEAMRPITDRPRELAVRSRRSGAGQILIMVEDHGVGISADNVDRLFDAFFSTKSSGLGLGLSICRSIVEAHGGQLSASNNAGTGATFQFVLPAHQDGASAARASDVQAL